MKMDFYRKNIQFGQNILLFPTNKKTNRCFKCPNNLITSAYTYLPMGINEMYIYIRM